MGAAGHAQPRGQLRDLGGHGPKGAQLLERVAAGGRGDPTGDDAGRMTIQARPALVEYVHEQVLLRNRPIAGAAGYRPRETLPFVLPVNGSNNHQGQRVAGLHFAPARSTQRLSITARCPCRGDSDFHAPQCPTGPPYTSQ